MIFEPLRLRRLDHAESLIVQAVNCLTKGRDIVVVAHPAELAFDLVEVILRNASLLSIANCVLSEDRRGPERNDPDVRLVIPRPFGWPAERTPSFRAPPVVLVDQSAVFERTSCVPPPYRTVEGF